RAARPPDGRDCAGPRPCCPDRGRGRRARTRRTTPGSVRVRTPGPSPAGRPPGTVWRSAALLCALACHAQGRTRIGLESKLADRVAAGLADLVRPVLQSLQGMQVLLEAGPCSGDEAQLVLPLEGLRPG